MIAINFIDHVGSFLKRYCPELNNPDMVRFHHDITFGKNEVSMLMRDRSLFEFYLDNNLPLICTDYSGRILENGIYINQVLEGKSQENAFFFKLFHLVGQRLGLKYGKFSLHYSQIESNCQHLYSLFFDLCEEDFLHYVINNGSIIQDLINEYNFKAKDLILEATEAENRAILPNSKDFFASNKCDIQENLTKNISVIHKISGLRIHLSNQRGQCLLHVISGKTVKEIAHSMRLSPKTIEHYLAILRKELGCRSTKELISVYANHLA